MRIEDITHNHFIALFEDGQMPETRILTQELAYSTFIAPTFNHKGMDFLYLAGKADDKFIPLFTDLDEYNMMFEGSDFTPKFYDFDYYLAASMPLIVNPTSIGVKINVENFKDMEETPVMPINFSRFTFSLEELKVIADNIQNINLLSILQESGSQREILMILSKSSLLTRLFVRDGYCGDGIAEIPHIFENVIITPDGYMELYTSKNEMKKEDGLYVQVVNLNHFFEYLIRSDLEGFIINPNSNHVVIDRNTVLDCFDEFKKEYDDSKYAMASHYAFQL